jgi:hypothetical protein
MPVDFILLMRKREYLRFYAIDFPDVCIQAFSD